MLERPLHAQDRPGGAAGRPWLSAGVALGRQDLGCPGCPRDRPIGGAAVSAAAGVTLPRNTGVALVLHRFSELSFEYSQQSRYVLVLGQYTPPSAPVLTINVGLGHGLYWGDGSNPYEYDGSGAVAGAGVAFRVPAGSVAALSISASYLGAFAGSREEHASVGSVARGPLRPQLLLIAASLSLAGPSLAPPTTAQQRRTWR